MTNYNKAFKEEALRLSDEIGVKKAASQLGIPYYTLTDWRQNRKSGQANSSAMSDDEMRIRNRELEKEIAELRKANEILKDALGLLRKKLSASFSISLSKV